MVQQKLPYPLQPVDRHIPESTSPYLDQHYAVPAPEETAPLRAPLENDFSMDW